VTVQTGLSAETRVRLARERVLLAAIDLADTGGVEALTMRRVAQELGVVAMSLYNHVANKDDLLDGMVDLVFGEIGPPPRGADWKTALRQRAFSARTVLARHPWAIGLMGSRSRPRPATVRHHDAMIGVLWEAGFSVATAAHASSLLDSYLYGFALQQASSPVTTSEAVGAAADRLLRQIPTGGLPHRAKPTIRQAAPPGGDDDADEFAFGLDLLLDGLERLRDPARRRSATVRRRRTERRK
jgi:AcrR family transcriptional regulator